MEKNIYTEKSVGEYYNKNFINCKFDGESEDGQEFTAIYDITAYPSYFFITPDGKVIKKKVGGTEAEDFIQWGKDVIDPENSSFNKLTKEFDAGNRSRKLLYEYYTALNDEGMESNHISNMILEMAQPSDIENDTVFLIFFTDVKSLKSPFSMYFVKNYQLFSLEYGSYARDKIAELISLELDNAIIAKDEKILDEMFAIIEQGLTAEDFKDSKKLIRELYDESVSN